MTNSELVADQFEIAGFNGSPLVQCGRALPIVRRKADDCFAVLDLSDGPGHLNWHGRAEADDLLHAGRWTAFTTPVPIPASCLDDTRRAVSRQPMVVYADQSLLDAADCLPNPPMRDGLFLNWRQLKGHPSKVSAACATEASVESLLNEWATGLIGRFEAMFRIGRDATDLRRLADFALCAARSKELRWRAYLYFCTVQDSDRVADTFNTFVQREFPQADFHAFAQAAADLKTWLGHAPPLPVQPASATSQPSAALPKVRDMASELPLSEQDMIAAP